MVNKFRIETNNSQYTKDWHVYLDDKDISSSISSLSFNINAGERPSIYFKFVGDIDIHGAIPIEIPEEKDTWSPWRDREPRLVQNISRTRKVDLESEVEIADLTIGSKWLFDGQYLNKLFGVFMFLTNEKYMLERVEKGFKYNHNNYTYYFINYL